MYDELQVNEYEEDDAVDAAGYTGNFRRENNKESWVISDKEFVELFKQDNKLARMMLTI